MEVDGRALISRVVSLVRKRGEVGIGYVVGVCQNRALAVEDEQGIAHIWRADSCVPLTPEQERDYWRARCQHAEEGLFLIAAGERVAVIPPKTTHDGRRIGAPQVELACGNHVEVKA